VLVDKINLRLSENKKE